MFRFLKIILFIIVSSISAYNQTWKHYNFAKMNGGLVRSTISTMSCDINGNIWAAGFTAGFSKFDGTNWKIINNFSVDSLLPDKPVYQIKSDNNGNTWIGTYGRILKININDTTIISVKKNNFDAFMRGLSTDLSGNIWICLDYGIIKGNINSSTISNNSSNYFLSSYETYDVEVDNSNNVWVATASGLAKFNGSSWVFYNVSNTNNGLPSDYVFDIFIDGSQNIWCSTYGGIGKLNTNGTWTKYTQSNSGGVWTTNYITSLIIDDNSNIWAVPSDGGVLRLNGNSWVRYINTNSGLPNDNVKSIAKDNLNNIWIGMLGGKVSKFDRTNWVNHNPTTNNRGVYGNNIISVKKDVNNTFYCSTEGGLAILNSNFEISGYTKFTNNQFSNDEVYDCLKDNQGNLWIATYTDLIKINGSNWTYFNPTNSSNIIQYYCDQVVQDSQNNIWIADLWRVSKFNGSSWVTYSIPSGIQRIIPNPLNNDVWVTSWGGGLYKFNGSSWTNYTQSNTSNGLPTNVTFDVGFHSDGSIWIAHFEGISRFDGSSWTTYTQINTNNGLPTRSIYAIKIDTNGIIWSGSGAGLTRFDGVNWFTYNSSNSKIGLKNSWVNDIAIKNSNEIWVGTQGGLSILNLCSDNLNLISSQDDILNISKTIKAKNIIATNKIINNSNVVFSINNSIQLNAGFKVENGSVFKTEFGGCTN